MKAALIAAAFALACHSMASAQSADELATAAGHEVSVGVGGYKYVEPGSLTISIHGVRARLEYTGTVALARRRHVFALADVRGSVGHVAYDGWCFPYVIRPSSSSPNGYQLGFGSASPCGETGDVDGYADARGIAGKDFLARGWALSPQAGLGVRGLSNGTTGVAGYRTDLYLYLPVAVTARTRIVSDQVISVTGEYDHLLHGWQTTRQSKLGGGTVPPTDTAPAFSIDAFTDLSFPQDNGWALRASAKYQVTRRWSIEPSYIHWHVGDSPIRESTVTFTVNGITAHQQLRAYEPLNVTDEWLVKLGFHF